MGGRLCDSVFVFKEFRLAYKCAGDYNTFKVKLINLLVSLLMAIRRKKKIAKTTSAKKKRKEKQTEVYQGVDNVSRRKITSMQSSREASERFDTDIKRPFTLQPSPKLVPQ